MCCSLHQNGAEAVACVTEYRPLIDPFPSKQQNPFSAVRGSFDHFVRYLPISATIRTIPRAYTFCCLFPPRILFSISRSSARGISRSSLN